MKSLLYVDGYNIIGAWREAEEKAWPLDECRDRLTRLLEDYAGYTGQEIWLVFDGHKAASPLRSVEPKAELTLVYTKHGETADQFIERMCQLLPKYREARVATSDGLEQTLILGRGATRLSARELWRELRLVQTQGRTRHREATRKTSSLRDALPMEQQAQLEKLRRQK